MRRQYEWVIQLPRNVKRTVLVCFDFCSLMFSLWLAQAIAFASFKPISGAWAWVVIMLPLLSVFLFWLIGLYRSITRFIGLRTLLTIFGSVMLSTSLLLVIAEVVTIERAPISIPVIYFMASLLSIAGGRILVQSMLQYLARRCSVKEPLVLYGAGAAGRQSAVAMRMGTDYDPVAFVDDDVGLQGLFIHGIEVHAPDKLEKLIGRHHVSKVVLAIPSTTQGHRRRIVERLEDLSVQIKTLPGLADLISGKARVDELRDLEIEDLLGRPPVMPDGRLMARNITDKNVLVSGAGGSIGSELCRQIVRQAPARLLILDVGEPSLYMVDRELREIVRQLGNAVEVIPLLGNVLDRERLFQVMTNFDIDTVYHAAAYKHVPLVEQNIVEGIQNNGFGTWHCAEAALAAGVETFVLVSTDKAVRPTNVMGASKRIAELILQGLSERGGGTCFTMVRFGNVLGSSGSVVPLFREQIRAGGPVTVTHPEVTRYFMTVSEAAELVIQAGAMAKGGEVFVLDMGQPVKILDVARRMIHLMGLQVADDNNPDGDIRIDITNLRAGEKLHEELLVGDNVEGTTHPRIMRAEEPALSWAEIQGMLTQLEEACRSQDFKRLRAQMCGIVTGYKPSDTIFDPMWLSGQREDRTQEPVAGFFSDKIH